MLIYIQYLLNIIRFHLIIYKFKMFPSQNFDMDLLAKASKEDPHLVNGKLWQLVRVFNKHNSDQYQPLSSTLRQLQEQNGFQNAGYSLYQPNSMMITRDDKPYDQNQETEQSRQSLGNQQRSAYFFTQQQFPAFPHNNEVWTSGQQQIFIQRFDGQSQQIQSRYLRNPRQQLQGQANVQNQFNISDPQLFDVMHADKTEGAQEQPHGKALQTQFYSIINFHCVLNEVNGGIPESVPAAAEQSNQGQNDDSLPMMYGDANEFDDMDEITGLPQARVRRPSRSQQFLQWMCLSNDNSMSRARGPRRSDRQMHAVYGLQVHTPFSKTIIKKTFEDFVRLQKVLVQLQDSVIEIRDIKTGKLMKFDKLKHYLPNLPRFGRRLTGSMLSSSQSQSKQYLTQGHRMQKIKSDLSIYCQQLLILLDILYFQNMQLKQIDDAYKFKRECQKLYRQFLNEQKDQLKAYKEKQKQTDNANEQNPAAKDEFAEDDRLNVTQGSGIRIESTQQKEPKNSSPQDGAKSAGNEPSIFQAFVGLSASASASAPSNGDKKKSKPSPQNSSSSQPKNEDEIPQFDDDEIQQVGDGRQTHQEASASQSTNNNDGVTHPDDIPISSNGSDRGGLQLPPGHAVNESPAIDDSEVEGEDNSPNDKKNTEQVAKVQNAGDTQTNRLNHKNQPKAPSKSLNTNRQREISNKQLNEEYRIKLFFSQQSSSLEPLDIFDMPFHPRGRPNHMSQLKLAARSHRLLMERYLKLNEVGSGNQPTGAAITKPKNNGLLIQKPKSNKSVSYKSIEPHTIDQNMWAYEILKFFKIPQIFRVEKKSAVKIEEFIKKVKKIRIKEKFNNMLLQLKGMRKNFQDLPEHLIIIVFQFLEENDRLRFMSTSKVFRRCLQSPILWKKIVINNSLQIFKELEQRNNFKKILESSTQLQVLSLKYCKYINKDTLIIINQHCNPFSLQELYLDGCEEITDDSLDCLVMKEEERAFEKQFKPKLANLVEQHDFFCALGDEASPETMDAAPGESTQPLAITSGQQPPDSASAEGAMRAALDLMSSVQQSLATGGAMPTSEAQSSTHPSPSAHPQADGNPQSSLISVPPPQQLENDKKPQTPELPKPPKIQKHVELPEYMRTLQDRFLNEHNIDAFLSMQDEEVLEFFHQNYNRNHQHNQQIRQKVENAAEDAKRAGPGRADDQIVEKSSEELDIIEEDKQQSERLSITTHLNTEIQRMIKREQDPMFQHLARAGLRGLKVLSLAECRKISNDGVAKLEELKFINKLNFLGCTQIDDTGAKFIANQFRFLKDVDLGGTNITAEGLRKLAEKCQSLKNVSIMGCKRVNNSDDQILTRRRINCQGVEDVFRFHLLPELVSSDLPQITKSVLKTRSTLGLNKVYKYLFRRLLSLKVDDLLRSENGQRDPVDDSTIPPEDKIEILCNGHYLRPTLQLKDVKEMYWQPPFVDNIPQNQAEDLLILHYRRKFSKQEQVEIKYDNQYMKRRQQLLSKSKASQVYQRPQQWVPKHLAFSCQNPDCGRQFESLNQDNGIQHNEPIYNCMRCGNCFCRQCTSYVLEQDNEFGYKHPIKVCKDCHESATGRTRESSQQA